MEADHATGTGTACQPAFILQKSEKAEKTQYEKDPGHRLYAECRVNDLTSLILGKPACPPTGVCAG